MLCNHGFIQLLEQPHNSLGELVDGVDCQTRCKSDFMMIVQLLTYVVQKSLAMRSEHLKSN